MSLTERFDHALTALELPAGPAVVAVSGGPDSLALLGLLRQSPAARGLELHVAHADHGIHPDSALVAERVVAVANRWSLPVYVGHLALGSSASETVARRARYQWLNRLARELGSGMIFTGHQQDDQVETILLRVLKGSGPAGLAGMAPHRGNLIRPLLPFRRGELAAFVQTLGVDPWNDPANSDPRHERSWLRGQILPTLRGRLPLVEDRILVLGQRAAVQRAGWDGLLERLPGLDLTSECDAVSVAASPLHGYDSSTQQLLLGALGRRVGCVIGPLRSARIVGLLRAGRSGAVVELGNRYAAELSFGRLRLFRGAPADWAPRIIEGAAGEFVAGEWRISWRREPAALQRERNPAVGWFPEDSYTVRPWHAGDRIRPLGGPGRRLVVRCMQDARIARSRRRAWPVIEAAGDIVWVPGACRSADRVPAPGTAALRIDAYLA